MSQRDNDSELLRVASRAREAAYAIYSNFRVGAAIKTTDGSVYTGCNVENLSHGLTMCAERIAVGNAIANGAREFVTIAIVTDSAEPAVPCGACRQVLAEFNPRLRVICGNLGGRYDEYALDALLPLSDRGILK